MKFNVLKYNQAVLYRIGLYSYRLNESSNEFFNSFASYYLLFSEAIVTFLTSSAFIYENWPKFDIISQPCLIANGSATCFFMILSVGFNLKSVKILHQTLQETVDGGKS